MENKDLFQKLEIIKLNLIKIFGEKQCSTVEDYNQREINDILEFFKISDELREVWIDKWLESMDCWDIIVSDTSITFVWVNKSGKILANKIEKINVNNNSITLCSGANINIQTLKNFGIDKDINNLLQYCSWIIDKPTVKLLSKDFN